MPSDLGATIRKRGGHQTVDPVERQKIYDEVIALRERGWRFCDIASKFGRTRSWATNVYMRVKHGPRMRTPKERTMNPTEPELVIRVLDLAKQGYTPSYIIALLHRADRKRFIEELCRNFNFIQRAGYFNQNRGITEIKEELAEIKRMLKRALPAIPGTP